MKKLIKEKNQEFCDSVNLLLKENNLQDISTSLSKMYNAYLSTTTDTPKEKQMVSDKFVVLEQHLTFIDLFSKEVSRVN